MLWFPFLPRDLPCRSRLPGVRLCARAALRVLPRHAYAPPRRAPRAAAPAQSYWQNATSFFVWYTVSTNCRSSGESV